MVSKEMNLKIDLINFQTPSWVCEKMVALVPAAVGTILEPTPGNGNLVKALSKNYKVITYNSFEEISGRFQAIVMNPPFSPMSLGYSILYKCMEMSNIIIALMPWLTIINSEKRLNKIIDFGLESIIHLPRNAFPGSRVQCCILKMIKGYNSIIRFERFTN